MDEGQTIEELRRSLRRPIRGNLHLARAGFRLREDSVCPLIEEVLRADGGPTPRAAAGLTAALAVEEGLGWDMGARVIDRAYMRRWLPDYEGRPGQ